MSFLWLLCRTTLLEPYTVRQFGVSVPRFSGHNKWSKIKEGKGANDSLKSKVYGKANRDIILAARRGGSADPTLNSFLATTIAKAKSNGVPKSNITSALEQAQKNKDTGSHQEYTYGALVGGSVGLSIECVSDNSTRTFREIREIIKSHGAQLASVSYMFKKVGQIVVDLHPGQSLEDLEDEALEGGAEDIQVSSPQEGEHKEVKIVVPPQGLLDLERHLKEDTKYSVQISEVLDMPIDLDLGATFDEKTRDASRTLIEELKEHPDVHDVRVSPELRL